MAKYIVYKEEGADHCSSIKEASEMDIPFKKINTIGFVLLYITNRRFRRFLRDTIFYSIRHYDSYRGTGASDVLLFECMMYENKKVFKRK